MAWWEQTVGTRRSSGGSNSVNAKSETDHSSYPGIPKKLNKNKVQEERKQQLKQEVLERYTLQEPPREGVQRVWTVWLLTGRRGWQVICRMPRLVWRRTHPQFECPA